MKRVYAGRKEREEREREREREKEGEIIYFRPALLLPSGGTSPQRPIKVMNVQTRGRKIKGQNSSQKKCLRINF